jgi:hypothetical protein
MKYEYIKDLFLYHRSKQSVVLVQQLMLFLSMDIYELRIQLLWLVKKDQL